MQEEKQSPCSKNTPWMKTFENMQNITILKGRAETDTHRHFSESRHLNLPLLSQLHDILPWHEL